MTLIRIVSHCLYQSFRHPMSKVVQDANPKPITMSPTPWWGSVIILVIGIISWCLSAYFNIDGLDEAGRAMVYIPLGNIFGMGLAITGRVSE